jgi:hypothetical protein
MPVNRRSLDHRLPLLGGLRADPRRRRQDEGALDDVWPALLVEEGKQRLADAEFGDRRLGVELRIGAQVCAAALTAFWSRGVKARSAC